MNWGFLIAFLIFAAFIGFVFYKRGKGSNWPFRCIVLVPVICFLYAGCGGGIGGSSSGPSPTFTGGMQCSHSVTSPKGVKICSGQNIGANVPAIVDQQLDDLFRIAEASPNNYHACPGGGYDGTGTCFSLHGTYHVWLIPRASVCENPGYSETVQSDPWPAGYDNDPNGWDKDPRPGHTLLCVAGEMAAGGGNMAGIAVPGMGVVDAVDQIPIVRYEGEHNLLAQADQERFVATQFHYGANGGHPILGDGTAQGLAARPKGPEQPLRIKDAGGNDLLLTK